MKGTYLGEFEELVLLAIAIVQSDGAYGNSILQEIEVKTHRNINLSAVHTALHRLVKKGFVKSHKGEATAVRGGKRKIYYELTAFGMSALKQAREWREEMWSAIPEVVLRAVIAKFTNHLCERHRPHDISNTHWLLKRHIKKDVIFSLVKVFK